MVRNVALGLGALVLATILSAVGTAVALRLSGTHQYMTEAAAGVEGEAVKRAIAEGLSPHQVLRRTLRWFDFVVLPCSVAMAGVFVGLFVSGRGWPVVAIALSPLFLAFVAGRAWAIGAWSLAVLYMLLACLTAQAVAAAGARERG